MVTDRIRITVVVQNDADLAFIENAGGNIGRGAKQAGFDKLLAFAQMTPRAFQAFLDGERFADVGELKRWDEACDAADAKVCPLCQEEIEEACQCKT